MFRRLAAATLVILACVYATPVHAGNGKDKIRVVIIDGQNNHDWKSTTPIMKKTLEDCGRFTVDVATSPAKDVFKDWQIDFSKYDVVLSNYNGQSWPKQINDGLEERLKAGKIGLVIVHAANNAFSGWKEYNLMIGMGWRGKGYGDRLKVDDSGKEVRVPKGGDLDSSHRTTGVWPVIVRDTDHPITKGMPTQWMHANDELYDNMRGPIENVHLLATAYSKGAKANEPMIWTVTYGKGRVFHTPMGHGTESMRCVGFQTTLERGTEWAATGAVTIPIPANFPTADKTSVVPAAKK